MTVVPVAPRAGKGPASAGTLNQSPGVTGVTALPSGYEALAASASYNLFIVNPGQTRTINLTVKPTGPSGTVVSGILYVDDFVDSLQFLSGSQLAALPYAYRVN